MSHGQAHLRRSHPGPHKPATTSTNTGMNGLHGITNDAVLQHPFGVIPIPDTASNLADEQAALRALKSSHQQIAYIPWKIAFWARRTVGNRSASRAQPRWSPPAVRTCLLHIRGEQSMTKATKIRSRPLRGMDIVEASLKATRPSLLSARHAKLAEEVDVTIHCGEMESNVSSKICTNCLAKEKDHWFTKASQGYICSACWRWAVRHNNEARPPEVITKANKLADEKRRREEFGDHSNKCSNSNCSAEKKFGDSNKCAAVEKWWRGPTIQGRQLTIQNPSYFDYHRLEARGPMSWQTRNAGGRNLATVQRNARIRTVPPKTHPNGTSP